MQVSMGLSRCIEDLWLLFRHDVNSPVGLLPDLDLDAVMARYWAGEQACIPRIIELVCLEEVVGIAAADAVSAVDFTVLTSAQRRQVELTLDAWWRLNLMKPHDASGSGGMEITEVLGVLAGSGCQMQRWLRIWLNHFDSSAAQLFVDAVSVEVVRGGAGPGEVWQEKNDEWVQYQTWCRSEATVLGLTMVGAAHVSKDRISKALDRLV